MKQDSWQSVTKQIKSSFSFRWRKLSWPCVTSLYHDLTQALTWPTDPSITQKQTTLLPALSLRPVVYIAEIKKPFHNTFFSENKLTKPTRQKFQDKTKHYTKQKTMESVLCWPTTPRHGSVVDTPRGNSLEKTYQTLNPLSLLPACILSVWPVYMRKSTGNMLNYYTAIANIICNQLKNSLLKS